MGIGNVTGRPAQVARSSCRLITPHGDWEHRPTVTMRTTSRSSLPLLGIGNKQPPPCHRRDLVLITPHGDWEPAAWSASRAASSAHYPSWGLGTRRSRRWGWVRWPAHYPSWGLGTRKARHREPRHLVLITPHGDWEPTWSARRSRSPGCSLPLMGIGNLTLGGEVTEKDVASLPLMGIGNCSRRSGCAAARTAHYPSWGLGTHGRRQRGRRVVHLITPHGDWERSRPGWTRPRLRAHYPSWGLGTAVADRLRQAGQASLPLMGIGNPLPSRRRSAAPATHYPSWGLGTIRAASWYLWRMSASLPLMGIGNPLRPK